MEATIVASSSLNQWCMDFTGNSRRIIESIVQAKRLYNAKIRVGSQSEVPGFSIEDHYLEPDTILHSWQVLAKILEVTHTPPYNDILAVVGMPVCFRGIIYNSAISVYNGEILLIRPKNLVNNDPITREKRWFTAWTGGNLLMEFDLPEFVSDIFGQRTTKFGNALLKSEDNYLIGIESLDEAKSPSATSTELFLMGAHIVVNCGGAPYELCDYDRFDCIKTITNKTGGLYVYSNFTGFDGSRNYFDGHSMVICNGKCLACTDPFSLGEVNLAVASVDLSEIDSHRSVLPSRNIQAGVYLTTSLECIKIQGLRLKLERVEYISQSVSIPEYTRAQQILNATSCYLWDYLRRSTGSGFFVPLRGGVDSASVLIILAYMCKKVLKTFEESVGCNKRFMHQDLLRILGCLPSDHHEMMQKVVYSAYFSSSNSSELGKATACEVASEVGCTHLQGSIEEIYEAYLETFTEFTGSQRPKFESESGTLNEDLALQALQSRIRMVLSYISGQLLTFAFNRSGFLIVLGCTSLEQNILGYHAKYGNSSADINPIGCISRIDLINMLKSLENEFPSITQVLEYEKTKKNELNQKRNDVEEDMGLSFQEIYDMTCLRNLEKTGPLSMFRRCREKWKGSSQQTAAKVKVFFTKYAANRHKMTVMTPLLHIDKVATEDNRYDLRQFLYNLQWTWQFNAIDEEVKNS